MVQSDKRESVNQSIKLNLYSASYKQWTEPTEALNNKNDKMCNLVNKKITLSLR